MRLSGLRIFGFKTFAQATTLSFDAGITAIVGPNGSGKSNLVDAIRWVLGEQSPKSLRSSKTDDVIFAGNERRKALGMAEVSLTFDNSDGRIDLPFKEVQLTRRAYRAGDIEYFINKERVRLRDVHELLMGTGLGPGSYAIVSQGQIDAILVSKPSDRRALFEETSGINKFLARKAEALRRLEGTNANVVRLHDLLREVEGRVPELETQVRRAKRYRSTSARLRDLEILCALRSGESRRQALSSARSEAERAQAAHETAAASALKAENDLSEARQTLIAHEIALEEARGAHETARTALAVAERDAAAAKARLDMLAHQFDTEHHNSQRREEERAQLLARIVALESEVEPLQERVAQLQEHESQATIAIAAARMRIESLFTALRDFERESNARASELARTRSTRENAERERDRLQAELARLHAEISEMEHANRDASAAADAAVQEIAHAENAVNAATSTLAGATEHAAAAGVELPQVQAHLRQVTGELAALEARLHTLEELEANLEGHVPGTRAIIDAKNRHALEGIIGVVASLIRVDERYARALDIAFGAGVSNIVAIDSHAAEAAIEYLRSKELGRATLLPLDLVGSRVGRELGRLSRIEGVIAYAHELVEVEERYRGVVAFLVGRTLVVDNMRTGVRLAREEQVRDSIVTLDGDQLMGGGAMSGGRSGRGERSILSRRAQAQSLHEEHLPNLREALLDAEADLAKAASAATAAVSMREEAQRELTERSAKLKELRTQANVHAQQARQAQARLEQVTRRSDEAERGLAQTLARLSELPQIIEAMDETRVERSRREAELVEARASIEQTENESRMTRAQAASARERLAALIAERDTSLTQHASLDADSERLRELREHAAVELAQLRASQDTLANRLSELTEALAAAHLQVRATQTQRESAVIAITRLEVQVRQARAAERDMLALGETGRRRIAELEAELGMLEDASSQQSVSDEERASVAERYAAEPDGITDELPRLREDLTRLANVNLQAEHDLEELQARKDELTTQLDDLAKARELLLAGIRELDLSCETHFIATFDVVREAFNAAYAELFPGGEAKMWLTDPEDVSSSGVEISVRPPGKKMTSLAALSGGERAMTAAALIFALIRVKPSPFYLLDEIDAALDEMNVERFSKMVRNLATDAQLLIVTHNKKTMELAQRMYGITMAEAGVSSIVTAALDREPALA